jgi:hypothetical protein
VRLLAAALLATVLSGAAAHAESEPRLDCGAGAATPTQHATVEIWFGGDLGDWAPPTCTGWSARPFTVLVEAFGDTALTGGPSAILARLARISDLTTILYWSTRRERWRDLIPDATALSGPDPAHRRTDFDEAELRAGPIFFWQEENTPLGAVTYRMSARIVDAQTVVVEINNALPTRAKLFASVPPGHHEFLYLFRQLDNEMWSLYGLMRSGSGPRLVARAGRKSYGNRAVALFRYLAGERTDGAPPLFP